ncbi:hypothetical protein D3C85_1282170 [compost metagenome]
MPLQEVTGAIVGIHNPAIVMPRQLHTGFLTDKVAREQLRQSLVQHDLDLAINFGLVPGASRPSRSHHLSSDQAPRFPYQRDHRIEQHAIDALAS